MARTGPLGATALALAILLAPALEPAACAAPEGSAVHSEPGFVHTSYHGNVSIMGPGPNEVAPVQSNLTVSYEIRDPGYGPAEAGLYLRFPAAVAVFNVSGNGSSFALTPRNVPITSTNWTAPDNTTFSEVLAQATPFTGGAGTARAAVLSTQAIALTSPLPFGGVRVDVRWSWNLVSSLPSVPSEQSGWLPSDNGTSVRPAQDALFTTPSGNSLSIGSPLQGCVDGPVAGRTFSMHLETLHPLNDFAQANATVPTDQSGPFCWSVPIPSYIGAQTLLVRLWDYANFSPSGANVTTLLLYSMNVKLVAASAASPEFGSPWEWALIVAGAGAIIGVILVLWRRRPRAPASARTMAADGGVEPPSNVAAGSPPRPPRGPPPSR